MSPGRLSAVLLASAPGVTAFDNSRFDNLAVYWGQNSYGATHTDVQNFQKPLAFYCQDDSIDIFPVAFLNTFFGPGGAPSIDLSNICSFKTNATFPSTELPICTSVGTDIKTCQAKGKILTLSLGGAGGSVGFTSDAQGESLADQVWDMFLGGSGSTRPFGDAVLDGVDLDIEGGISTGYAAFVNRIRSHASSASKKYYVTAAPQCLYPDSSLGNVLNAAEFDAVYVQFYNNPCGLPNFNQVSNWNYGLWDNWARTISPNPNVKIYIGAPASPTAAGTGYQTVDDFTNIIKVTRQSFPSFGGVMMWDASQAYANNRYDLAIKNALVAAGGTGFNFPPCNAPAYAPGTAYTAGQKVSYSGYIWEAKWWSSSTPTNTANGDWSAISACSGTPTNPTAPSGAPTSAPTSGSRSCGGVAAWSGSTVYTGGQQATFNGNLWTANWWTQGDTPGGQAGAWTDNNSCSSKRAVEEWELKPSRFWRV